MSAIKDMTQLGRLVARNHGWDAARAFKAQALSEPARAALSQGALDLLRLLPEAPMSSALLSAALAVSLERRIDAPVHVVTGALSVNGSEIFGADASVEDMASPTWNGHAWVMIGSHVVDIALFRIAYSAQGPAPLAKHVDLVFGPGKGLYVDEWKRTRRVGLGYAPARVLSAEEVTALMGHAFHLIKQARADTPSGE